MNEFQESQRVSQSAVDAIIDSTALETMFVSLRIAALDTDAPASRGALYFLEGIQTDDGSFLHLAFSAFQRFGGDRSVGGLTIRAALRQLIDMDDDLKAVIS